MEDTKLAKSNVAERITISVGPHVWRFHNVTVVVHRVVSAVDIWKDDEHVMSAPLSATCIEWRVVGESVVQ